MYMFNAHGNDVASHAAKQIPASLGICAPAALNMTVPFSRASHTSVYVIRASSKESPRGTETSVICYKHIESMRVLVVTTIHIRQNIHFMFRTFQPDLGSVDPRAASKKSSVKASCRSFMVKKFTNDGGGGVCCCCFCCW